MPANSKSSVIGFHGSRGNHSFDECRFGGLWFVEDSSSDLLDYYANRDGQSTVITAELDLARNLDLTMYNADEMAGWNYAAGFLTDIELSNGQVDEYINHFYFSDFATNFDDDGEPSISFSAILNHVIAENLIRNDRFDSVSIMEGNDHVTHCMLAFNKIRVTKVSSHTGPADVPSMALTGASRFACGGDAVIQSTPAAIRGR